MSVHTNNQISLVYAQSVSNLCDKQNSSEVRSSFEKILSWRSCEDIKSFLHSSFLCQRYGSDFIRLMEENGVHPLVLDFFRVLREKKKTHLIFHICEEFLALSDTSNDKVVFSVLTALPLKPEQEKSMRVFLQRYFDVSKEIVITSSVDTTIIAGFIVCYETHWLDMSMRSILKNTESVLEEKL